MSEVYLMTTICDRNQSRKFLSFYKDYGVDVTLVTLGRGTAASEVLDAFGLEEAEKAMLFSVVTGTVWKTLKLALQRHMKIDVPGTGIAFVVPISSIGGKKPLQFLTDKQDFVKGEESTLKETKHELLIAIANQGYTDLIMEAARGAGAGGGTVIHAKGTGMEKAEKFLGVSIAAEKEMVVLVTRREDKNRIMKAIMDKAGLSSKARSIVFSLPVTDTAGMRLMEEDADE